MSIEFQHEENVSPDRVILLEFPDEAQAYLEHCRRRGIAPSDSHVIALHPKVQAWLHQREVRCVNTLSYFSPDAHARALRKSNQLLNWLDAKVNIQDGLGIKDAYSNALVWYSRYVFHHFLWVTEILAEAHLQHPNATLQAFVGPLPGHGSAFVDDQDRYLGLFARDLCANHGVPFDPIESSSPSLNRVRTEGKLSWPLRLGLRIGARFHWAALGRMGRRRPLLSLTRGLRMEALVEQVSHELPGLPWVVQGEIDSSLRGLEILRRATKAIVGGANGAKGQRFIGEYWIQVLQRATKEDPGFVRRLDEMVAEITEGIEEEKDLFSHRDISYGPYYAARLRAGIRSAIRMVHREIQVHDKMLNTLQPRMILAPFGRRSYEALGELSKRRKIPGLLVSHGSFAPMKDDLEDIGWRFHSYGMLHGSYDHAAWQTPLAEAFSEQIDATARFHRTGPLIWGRQVDRTRSSEMRAKLVPDPTHSRVILHAGTAKGRRSYHFHVYETPDEYIAALQELILAVNDVPNTFLIIKFRPQHIALADLRALLPASDSYTISVEEPFLDVLAISDLLVSFASTTIEEALLNRVPVLLYGGGGRYKHVDAVEATPDQRVKPSAVYHVREPAQLGGAINQILDINGKPPLPAELFEQYAYKQDEVTSLPNLVRELVQS